MMKQPNPFKSEAKTGDAGRASERKLAKSLGARLTPASGAMVGAKSDMVLNDYRIEAKSTSNNSMSLQLGWLVKITEESLNTNKTPALAVTFTDLQGKPVRFGEWVMIPLHHYKELTQK